MADNLCGPSNALKKLQNHQAVDRTPQKDQHTGGQHGLGQGFRSTPKRVAENDANLAAFEAGPGPPPQITFPVPSPDQLVNSPFGQRGAQGSSQPFYQVPQGPNHPPTYTRRYNHSFPKPVVNAAPGLDLAPQWVEEFTRAQGIQPLDQVESSMSRGEYPLPEIFTLEGKARARYNASRTEELPDVREAVVTRPSGVPVGSLMGQQPAQGALMGPGPAQEASPMQQSHQRAMAGPGVFKGASMMRQPFQGPSMMHNSPAQYQRVNSDSPQHKTSFGMPPALPSRTMQSTQQEEEKTKISKQREDEMYEAAFAQMEKQLEEAKITAASPRSRKSESVATNKSDSPVLAQKSPEQVKAQEVIQEESPVSKPKANIDDMWGDEEEIKAAATEQPTGVDAGTIEIGRIASVLLDSVKRIDSPKFRDSKFLALMRGFRDHDILVGHESFRLREDESVRYPNVLDVLERIDQRPGKTERDQETGNTQQEAQPGLVVEDEWQPDETEMVGHRHALHPGGAKYPAK